MSNGANEIMADMLTLQLVAENMSRLTSPDAPHLENLNARYTDLDRCCPLDNTQHSEGFTFPPTNTLGALDMLPPELSTQALLHMDISTLTTFRRVNQCARGFVDSLYQYHEITAHAPTVLRATLASSSANWITIPNLHSALTRTHQCSNCSDFGAFISLFSCTRTCFLCASGKTALHPLKPSEARVRYALDEPSSDALRRLKIIPGQYTVAKPDPATYVSKRKRYTLVDRQEAIAAGVKLHGSMRKMLKVVASRERDLRTKLHAAGIRKSRRACHALGINVPLDHKSNNPHRLMGLVRAPWINRQTRVIAEWGVFCKACSPCLTADVITLLTDEDPCLRCEGCKKCDYRHLGDTTGGCKACLPGSKHKHSDGRRMFRREDYAAHFDECERSKEFLANANANALSMGEL